MDILAYLADSVLSAYQGLMHNADICYCRNHGICQALFLHRPGLRRFHIFFSFPPQPTVFCLFYCSMPSGTVKAILRTADNSCEQSQMWVPQKNKKLRNTTPQHFAHKTHIEPPRFYAKRRTLICNRLYIDFVPNKRIIMKANFKGKEINYGFNQGYDCRQ